VAKKHVDPESMNEEVYRLKRVRHLNGVVKIHSYNKNVIYLEEIKGEDLFTVFSKRKKFKEDDARYIAMCLLRIVKNLHDINIIHGDIKPENIMYNEQTRDVVLVDFEYHRHTSNYGAPESIKHRKYMKKSDVWGIGTTIYTLLMGHTPFNNEAHLFSGIQYHDMDLRISLTARSFIRDTLIINHHKRPTIKDCFKYAWFSAQGHAGRSRHPRPTNKYCCCLF
jgi:serine/threonine protein kinase